MFYRDFEGRSLAVINFMLLVDYVVPECSASSRLKLKLKQSPPTAPSRFLYRVRQEDAYPQTFLYAPKHVTLTR